MIRGRARMTVFAAEGTARTFDLQAGDVGIVPKNMGHFVENLSDDEEVEMLEIFRADEFRDFSLFQWYVSSIFDSLPPPPPFTRFLVINAFSLPPCACWCLEGESLGQLKGVEGREREMVADTALQAWRDTEKDGGGYTVQGG